MASMVEDGVYYESYGNYAALFQGWLAAYGLLILRSVFVFGRPLRSHLSLTKQLAVGMQTMAVLAALPFALFWRILLSLSRSKPAD